MAFENPQFKADLLCEEDQKRLDDLLIDIKMNFKGDKSDLKKVNNDPSPFAVMPEELAITKQIDD